MSVPEGPKRPPEDDELDTLRAGSGEHSTVAIGAGQAFALERGSTVGPYLVLELLGAGGMGVVYAGWDPRLERRVAVKLLRMGRAGAFLPENETRLLREAQAMARITHPNVVMVHDVGLFEGKLYLAMEYVQGRTLDFWLREATRSWPEVVEAFLAAGRGLCAAHQAGVVHRDFKLENVLVGNDGRVRVTDFGIALAGQAELPPPPGESGPDTASPSERLTGAGGVIGTPAYMAPEQRLGLEVGPAADQYSFCVSLYEALFHVRPEGAVPAGRKEVPLPPGPRTKVPARLRRLLARGLCDDPAGRFPQMEALLVDLGQALRPPRTWAWAGAAAAGVAAAAIAVVTSFGPDPCAGMDRYLEEGWNPKQQDRIRAALLSTATPYAQEAWEKSQEVLTRWSTAWSQERRAACEATVRKEQPEPLLALRMGCLHRRLKEFHGLVEVLATADAQVAERAVQLSHGLSPVHGCGDLASLGAKPPLPGDPERRALAQKAQEQLSAARPLVVAGRLAEAGPVLDEALEQAEASGHAPTRAEALYARAHLQERRGELAGAEAGALEAGLVGEAAGDDDLSARARTLMAAVIGNRRGQFEEAEVWERLARASIERGGSDEAAALLEEVSGILEFRKARYGAAAERWRRLVQTNRRLHGPQSPQLAVSLNNLGNTLGVLCQYEEAEESLREALDLRIGLFGESHPQIASTLNNLAVVAHWRADLQAAEEGFTRARALQTRLFGPDHPAMANSTYNLGLVQLGLGRPEEALSLAKQSLALREKLNPQHPERAYDLGLIGLAQQARGQHLEAKVALEQAVALSRPEHQAVSRAQARLGLAVSLEALGERALAARAMEGAGEDLDPNCSFHVPTLRKLERWREERR